MKRRRHLVPVLVAAAGVAVASTAAGNAAALGDVTCPPPGPRPSGPLPGIQTAIVCGAGPDAVLITPRARVRLGPPVHGWQLDAPGGVVRGTAFEREPEPAVVRVRRGERVTLVLPAGYRPHRPTVAYPSWSRYLEWRSVVGVNRYQHVTLRVRRHGAARLEIPWLRTGGPLTDPCSTRR